MYRTIQNIAHNAGFVDFENLMFCYENEFYKEGAKLFDLINEDGLDEELWKKAKKVAEVCRIKI